MSYRQKVLQVYTPLSYRRILQTHRPKEESLDEYRSLPKFYGNEYTQFVDNRDQILEYGYIHDDRKNSLVFYTT